MLIREMMDTDLAEVCRIEQEIFSNPWSYEDFEDSYKSENNTYLIVEVDGRIAGYCGYWGIADEGYIYNVAVREGYRRQQIGYRMVKELILHAKDKGITALTLEVRQSNEAARSLYERLGFMKAGVRKDFYTKPKEDAVIMWLQSIQQFPL